MYITWCLCNSSQQSSVFLEQFFPFSSLTVPLVWHAPEPHVRFLSCCASAFMADWEQQVWLCKSKVSVFLMLLSRTALHSHKYRIQLWKVQFATGVALPFQHDLSLISRGRSEPQHEQWKWTHSFRWGFYPFKCHPIGPCLTKLVQFSLSHLLCVLECVCACSGVCVVSWQPRMLGRSCQLLAPSGLLPWWSHLSQ